MKSRDCVASKARLSLERSCPIGPLAVSFAPVAVTFTLIINRNASRLRQNGPILEALHRVGANAHVIETRSIDELHAAVRSLGSASERPVLFAGGDGTYSNGVTALAAHFGDKLPSVGFLPGGTVSTIIRNWGFSGSRVSFIRSVAANASAPAPITIARPTLRIRANGAERSGFICGGGLVSAFFDEYYKGGSALGYSRAAKIVGRIFVGAPLGTSFSKKILEPISASLTIDGEQAPISRVSVFVASVVPNVGLHMLLTYKAGTRRDGFHVVASGEGSFALARQLPRVLLGNELKGEHIDQMASHVRLRLHDRRGFILDGETIDAAEVEIENGPSLPLLTSG